MFLTSKYNESYFFFQGGNSVVVILSKMLDEPDLELRTEVAEGLCKLLMIGAISSPKLLSRLLLMWYNPMTESNSKLRHILGTFFPLYSSMSKAHQMAIESAFIPTMKVKILIRSIANKTRAIEVQLPKIKSLKIKLKIRECTLKLSGIAFFSYY